ncbi:N-acetylglucosaminidase [Bacillus bombysepticus]|uniref:N-acetylglucosaminidase n=1 Tax=Bacillus bombysepticus TaxID=658666 RepID=UPI003018F8DD
MKKLILSSALSFALLGTSLPVSAATGSDYALKGTTLKATNVYSTPAFTNQVLGLSATNKTYTVLSSDIYWSKISYQNKVGYVPRSTLSLPPKEETGKDYWIVLENNHKLYNGTYDASYAYSSLAYQPVSSNTRYGHWFLIDTWLGKKWINTLEEKNQILEYKPTKENLYIQGTSYIHWQPFSEYKSPYGIANQTVNVIGKSGNWYQIETWMGPQWIYYAPPSPPPIGTTYQLVDGTTQSFSSSSELLNAFQQASINAYIIENGTITNMKSGFARSTKYTIVYNNSGTAITYIGSNTEMKVTGITNDKVFVSFDGVNGYVPKGNVTLHPYVKSESRSYYMRKNGEWIHYLYNPSTKSHSATLIGKAPSFISENNPIYSNDMNVLEGQAFYSYYTHLSVKSDSVYTASELDNYIRSQSPDSPLIGTGKDFVAVGKKYGVNPLYLLAHAIHESNWGKSKIAQDKHNLFGLGAVDSDPYNSATNFASFQDCIEKLVTEWLLPGYLNPTNWKYFSGGILGNKSVGMNVKYASDAYWGEKIASHMYRADKYLGMKDYGKYNIAKIPKGTKLYDYNLNTNQLKLVESTTADRYVTLSRSEDFWTTSGNYVKQIYADNGPNTSYRNFYVDRNSIQPLFVN